MGYRYRLPIIMIVINNNGIYGGLDDDIYKEITNDSEAPTSITR